MLNKKWLTLIYQPFRITGVHQFLSAICPLKLQKLSEKQQNQFFVICRKTPILRALRAIIKSCKKPSEIFNSRTGHHTQGSEMTLNRHF